MLRAVEALDGKIMDQVSIPYTPLSAKPYYRYLQSPDYLFSCLNFDIYSTLLVRMLCRNPKWEDAQKRAEEHTRKILSEVTQLKDAMAAFELLRTARTEKD